MIFRYTYQRTQENVIAVKEEILLIWRVDNFNLPELDINGLSKMSLMSSSQIGPFIVLIKKCNNDKWTISSTRHLLF